MTNSSLPKMVPHTAAKHALLKLYLDPWFAILGQRRKKLIYIDGFAGPGEYQDGESGSPIIALESAKEHIANKTLPDDIRIHFLFIERDKKFFDHLNERLNDLDTPPQFRIVIKNGECADELTRILTNLKQKGKPLHPTFAFVDPFGFSGIPFNLMAGLLEHPHCEVFINVMVEFVNRFLQHPDASVTDHFPITFGTDEVMEIPSRQGQRTEMILELYRKQLRKHASYVGRFDMHGKRNQQTYSLFFASNARKGFEKMKEAMWSVDKASGRKFSDPFVKHLALFEAMGIESLWDDLLAEYKGRTANMARLETFVIDETDFLPKHLRQILRVKESEGKISVTTVEGYARRKGDFPSTKVKIHFQ